MNEIKAIMMKAMADILMLGHEDVQLEVSIKTDFEDINYRIASANAEDF